MIPTDNNQQLINYMIPTDNNQQSINYMIPTDNNHRSIKTIWYSQTIIIDQLKKLDDINRQESTNKP